MSSSHNFWIIDLGASDHICHDHVLFLNLNRILKPFSIILPIGNTIKVLFTTTITIISKLSLTNILFVPNFCYNLLHVSKFINQIDYKIIFTTNLCLMQDTLVKMPLVLGRFYKGLYLLYGQTLDNVPSYSSNSKIVLSFESINCASICNFCNLLS